MFRSSGVICNQELASAYLESREGKAGRWLSATPGEADLGCDGITKRRRSDEGTEVGQRTSLNAVHPSILRRCRLPKKAPLVV